MKLTIVQDLSIPETEITIRCGGMTPRLQKLIEQIRVYSFSLTGFQENRCFQLPLHTICYIDSTDGRTFLYREKEVYASRETLSALEQKLARTSFVRISKSCILNTDYLVHVEPLYNHRLKAVLKNGEALVITRSYIQPLKDKLKGAQS